MNIDNLDKLNRRTLSSSTADKLLADLFTLDELYSRLDDDDTRTHEVALVGRILSHSGQAAFKLESLERLISIARRHFARIEQGPSIFDEFFNGLKYN